MVLAGQAKLPHTLIRRGARCGCLDREDDSIDLAIGGNESSGGEDFVAVNVKLFFSERDGSVIHTSPEFRHEPHMTVVIEVQPVRVSVMLQSPEVETQAQAGRDGRLVEVGRMLDILRFSRGSGSVIREEVVEDEAH